MKIKAGFLLREVAGSYVVVATGVLAKEFNGIIKLNETGCFLWKRLMENTTVEALVKALTEEYDVSAEDAAKDVEGFVAMLLDAGMLEK